jgi:hypothetical protein
MTNLLIDDNRVVVVEGEGRCKAVRENGEADQDEGKPNPPRFPQLLPPR